MRTGINLLPAELKPARRSQMAKKNLMFLAAVIVLILLYLSFIGRMWFISKRIVQVEKQLESLQSKVSRAQAYKSTIKELQEKEKQLRQAVEETRSWTAILEAVNTSVPGDVWLLHLEENSETGFVLITGGSHNLQSIGNLAANLRQKNIWRVVEIEDIKGDASGLNFTIKAVY